jgi:thymidylate synthase (FAD)
MIEVTYVDHMGSDLSVVNAARVSFGKKSDWLPRVHNGEQLVLTPKDAKLISYLAKHQHKSPFNHAFATFHIKAPIFVARQLQKHEYMPWNEISRRYVDSEPEFYQPDVWRGRSADKKQGSEGEVTMVDISGRFPLSPRTVQTLSDGKTLEAYRNLIDAGVAPEQARMVLPQSMMTEWYWSGSLYAFAKMCGLRLKPDTQYETRLVAEQIEDKMTELFPESWTALRAYDDR